MSIFSVSRQSRQVLHRGNTKVTGLKMVNNYKKEPVPDIMITTKFDRDQPRNGSFWGRVLFCFLALVSTITHVAFSFTQTTPYMDEIFHIPQTQQYCKGNFKDWDDKITTLPGLYILPSSIAVIFGQYFSCTPFVLRSFNLIVLFCTFWLFYFFVAVLNPNMTEKKRAFMAVTLSLFPLNFFFTFLFYTDPLSTFLVLFMSYLQYKNHAISSAIVGAYAVFTRQTNIIWVMWMAFTVTWNLLSPEISAWNKALVKKFQSNENYENGKIKRKKFWQYKGNGLNLVNLEDALFFWSKCIVKIAPKVIPYALIAIAFVTFVVVNGGIVVGDRLAHQVSINIPQLFYFALFLGSMLSPVIILSGPKRILGPINNNKICFVALVGIGLIAVSLNTVIHPYLLADNRHYNFYIWKRLYEWYPIGRYCLVPCYIIIWFWICSSLKYDSVLMTGFFMCLIVALVPQKLMEFRYYIIPFFFVRLNINYTDWKYLISEFILYAMIDTFTIYQFVANPFVTAGDPELRRFMW